MNENKMNENCVNKNCEHCDLNSECEHQFKNFFSNYFNTRYKTI